MRTSKAEKQRRAALLTAQSGECALCGNNMSTAIGMVVIKKQNAMICRRCNQFKNVYQAGIRDGLTPEVLAAFLARDPAPEPTPADTRQHKKLTRSHLVSRLTAAQGKIEDYTLADHDKRFGTSGPVIDPDTGLEWTG